MFFEYDCESLHWKYCFENMEVFAEKKISLHDNFIRTGFIEWCIFFDRSFVWFCIIFKYLSQTFFHLMLLKHYWFIYFGYYFLFLIFGFGKRSHELRVIYIKLIELLFLVLFVLGYVDSWRWLISILVIDSGHYKIIIVIHCLD